ncbi:Crossover junction endonuclease mus81 [Chytridiales sp. JEL 0842]|nr:Crossover junction endonuclease mus81 [Chytridiales sp. JEL 0842]
MDATGAGTGDKLPLKDLFLQWLYSKYVTEREFSMSKGGQSRLHAVYKKAHDELKKYPAHINHPKDALVVNGIGPSILKFLETKLHDYVRDKVDNGTGAGSGSGSGLPSFADGPAAMGSQFGGGGATSAIKGKGKQAKSNDGPSSDKLTKQATTGTKRKRSNAEYVPKYRSAPWGILLALRGAADSVGYLSKQETVKLAQPHVDTPLDMPGPGGIYTGWSSMSTLLEKELVMKYGNPARFTLTEEGRALADNMIVVMRNIQGNSSNNNNHALVGQEIQRQFDGAGSSEEEVEIADDDGSVIDIAPVPSADARKKARVATDSFEDLDVFNLKGGKKTVDDKVKIPVSQSKATVYREESPSSFEPIQQPMRSLNGKDMAGQKKQQQPSMSLVARFWYLNTTGDRVKSQKEAAVEIIGDKVAFHCEFERGDTQSLSQSIPPLKVSKNGGISAYLADSRSLPELSPGFPEKHDSKSQLYSTEPYQSELFPAKSTKRAADLEKKLPSVTLSKPPTIPAKQPQPAPTLPTANPLFASTSSHQRTPTHNPPLPIREPSPFPPSLLRKDSIPTYGQVLDFAPGSYDIILLLDSREVKNGGERKFFQETLRAKGVLLETRSLELGDVMWIARKKGTVPEPENEIALDYIIERKTLGDLVASIKDGRFKEQKCGLRHVMYLVEEITTEEAELFGWEAVFTAITQTQVENRFFLKKTYSAEESATYLHAITNFIIGSLQGKRLQAPFRSSRDKRKVEVGQKVSDRDLSDLLTVSDFNRLNTKTKNFTLADVWLRQLMTIPGISAEKAASLGKVYPTGSALFKALGRCTTDVEREQMLQRTGGEGRKGVGNAVAKRIVNVFWHSHV